MWAGIILLEWQQYKLNYVLDAQGAVQGFLYKQQSLTRVVTFSVQHHHSRMDLL